MTKSEQQIEPGGIAPTHGGQHRHGLGTDHEHAHHAGIVKDPVCGMDVPLDAGKPSTVHAGTVYHFCSQKCHDKFLADPGRYLSPIPVEAQAAPAAAEYVCPMHPEVLQTGPGTCPKCGMALEPVVPEIEQEEDDGEYRDFRRRFWGSLPLTVVVVLLAMAGHLIAGLTPAARTWTELLLSAPVVLWAGGPFFVRGWQSIVRRSPNMWTLIGIGTGAAFAYSVVATLAPGLFPPRSRPTAASASILRRRR